MKKILISLVAIILLALAGAATVFGFMPVVSDALGFGQKDLGITYTMEDSIRARKLSGDTEIISLPAGTPDSEDFRLEGKKDFQFTMDSRELTAHSNNRPWKNYPVKNLQIKIHEDGTIESSAILVVSKTMPYAMGLGYSEAQIKEAMKKYAIPPFEVPVYVKGKGSVINNSVSVAATTVQIGAVTLPAQIVSQANSGAEQVLEDVIRKHSQSFQADELSFQNGKMFFRGQVPLKEYVITQ